MTRVDAQGASYPSQFGSEMLDKEQRCEEIRTICGSGCRDRKKVDRTQTVPYYCGLEFARPLGYLGVYSDATRSFVASVWMVLMLPRDVAGGADA